jgi:hypothetical protein
MKRLGTALLLLALAAVPGLIVSGLIVLFANPCFFRQFPQPGCPAASILPGSAGWPLILGGMVLLAVIALAGFAAKAAGGAR